jgi:hypothetical protein
MRNHAWMWILWPSFLVAVTATRQQVYAGGFFFFWLMAALSSALTIHMAPRRPLLDEFGEPIQD